MLNAWIMKPRDFDPGKTYPLLLYVYGGPGSQTVRDSWGGTRYLWHQMLVRDGILVASVDNRGTGARGREFEKQVYLRLGQLETADQLAAIRQLGDLPYVDASRIGIWGWSYGGYMALMTSLLGGSQVAAAIAGAPVTSWELYDTIYTERFMRTPQENPEGYSIGAPLSHAEGLEGELLIIHGTADDNVHPAEHPQDDRRAREGGEAIRHEAVPGSTSRRPGARPLGQPVRDDDPVPSPDAARDGTATGGAGAGQAGWVGSRLEGIRAGASGRRRDPERTERQRGRSQHGCGPSCHGARMGRDQYPVWQIAHDCVLRSAARSGSKSGPCGFTRQPSLAE